MIRHGLYDVFNIYGIDIDCHNINEIIEYKIIAQDSTKIIKSHIYINKNDKSEESMSPFYNYCVEGELVPPFLLLLDPIEYFRRYSVIIQKYKILDCDHTLGIYELLLEYFPEMDKVLVEKYWAVRSIFFDSCVDVAVVVWGIMMKLRKKKIAA